MAGVCGRSGAKVFSLSESYRLEDLPEGAGGRLRRRQEALEETSMQALHIIHTPCCLDFCL